MAKQAKGKKNPEQRQKQEPNIQRELSQVVTDRKAKAGQEDYMEQLMEYQWHEE